MHISSKICPVCNLAYPNVHKMEIGSLSVETIEKIYKKCAVFTKKVSNFIQETDVIHMLMYNKLVIVRSNP